MKGKQCLCLLLEQWPTRNTTKYVLTHEFASRTLQTKYKNEMFNENLSEI